MSSEFSIRKLNKKLNSIDCYLQLLCISMYLDEINECLQNSTEETEDVIELLEILNKLAVFSIIQPQNVTIRNLATLQKRLTNKIKAFTRN